MADSPGTNPEWNDYIHTQLPRWRQSILALARFGQTRPLLVILFEDLKVNVAAQVEKMVNFLQVAISNKGWMFRSFIESTEMNRMITTLRSK